MLLGEPVEVDMDSLACRPVVLLCYEPLTAREKRTALTTMQSVFPSRHFHFAPAEAVFATVSGSYHGRPVFNRYRLESLRGNESVVVGPEGSPVAGQRFRVWWCALNPWTLAPAVVYLDPMPESLTIAERRHWQEEMLFQLGKRFLCAVNGRNFPIANAAFGFAQVYAVHSESVQRQRTILGIKPESTRKKSKVTRRQ
jgi:hypothetical protein